MKTLDFWAMCILVGTFAFPWLGYAVPSIRVPLVLTYLAFWLFGFGAVERGSKKDNGN